MHGETGASGVALPTFLVLEWMWRSPLAKFTLGPQIAKSATADTKSSGEIYSTDRDVKQRKEQKTDSEGAGNGDSCSILSSKTHQLWKSVSVNRLINYRSSQNKKTLLQCLEYSHGECSFEEEIQTTMSMR